jgi:hypothetical protein
MDRARCETDSASQRPLGKLTVVEAVSRADGTKQGGEFIAQTLKTKGRISFSHWPAIGRRTTPPFLICREGPQVGGVWLAARHKWDPVAYGQQLESTSLAAIGYGGEPISHSRLLNVPCASQCKSRWVT